MTSNNLERGDHSPIVIRPAERTPAAYTDADWSISESTARRLIDAVPDNTRAAYDRNWSQFDTWCQAYGRVALPTTAQTLAGYVDSLILIEFAPATIDQVIGTIRSRHAAAGFEGQPDTRETLKLLRAYRREWAATGGRTRRATPVLLPALRAMIDTCDPDTLAGVRDRGLLLIGFAGMLRRSEGSGLDQGDFQLTGQDGAVLHIRMSKTDQDAKGAAVAVPYGQHAETCAVRSVQAWMAVLEERSLAGGALFRPLDRHGRIGGEPLRCGKLADRLTGTSVSDIVRRRAKLAGLTGHYSGHSLRSGGATAAYLAGAPVSEIAAHGRWVPTSPVVLGYIRGVDKWTHNPMKGVGL